METAFPEAEITHESDPAITTLMPGIVRFNHVISTLCKSENELNTRSDTGDQSIADRVETEPADDQVQPQFALWFNDDQFTGRTGDIVGYLASVHDANTRLVTASTSQMLRNGLLPDGHGFTQGDQLFTVINGQLVIWKVNRRNGQTMAAHFPPDLELPAVVDGRIQRVTYRVTVLGPRNSAQLVCHLSDSPNTFNL